MDELFYTFHNGDRVYRTDKALITYFNGRRGVISTSPFNGGLRNDLKTVFNYDCVHYCTDPCAMYAPDYAGHMRIVAEKLGLDANTSAGLSTAVYMKNAAIAEASFKELAVTAIVTAGIDVNGGRAGDPASLYEVDGQYQPIAGTINIMVFMNTNLSDTALTRAIITATEAKTAALQENSVASNYSQGLATGSGTDGIIVSCDRTSAITLTEAGKHYKLGELIGQTVKQAVAEGLDRHSHINPRTQSQLMTRLKRFGITETLLNEKCQIEPLLLSKRLQFLSSDPYFTQLTALYLYLIDECTWGLCQNLDTARDLLRLMGMPNRLDPSKKPRERLLEAYLSGLINRLII